MRLSFLILSFLIANHVLDAQRFRATESTIKFFSEAPMENIEAVNKKGASVLDLESSNIVFSVPIDQFVFDKSLMQEHFNENYLESHKYPKALFLGTIDDNVTEGQNSVTVSGELELHGVKRNISVTGIMIRRVNSIVAEAVFSVFLKDYNIKIPKAVFYNIAEEIEITVNFEYEKI